VKDYRRARFLELLNVRFRGNRAALMRATGLTNGRLTQLIDPDEPFGDTAARRLVEKLGLEAGYFDPPKVGDHAPSAAGFAVAMTYDRMSPGQQELFLKLLEASFGAAPSERPKELGHSDMMDLDIDLTHHQPRKDKRGTGS